MKLTIQLEGIVREFQVDDEDIHYTNWDVHITDMLDSLDKAKKI